MGYKNSLPSATHLSSSPLLHTISLSSSFMRNGTNLFAAEIHRHCYSLTKIEFFVNAQIFGTPLIRQINPFPVVATSRDVSFPSLFHV